MNFDKLDLSRLAKRLVSEDGLKDEAFALLTIAEYKRFFFLLTECEDAPRSVYLPSPIVDLVWQRHYFTDCDIYDMPHGYCHCHELRSSLTLLANQASAEAKEDNGAEITAEDSIQHHYTCTMKAYEEIYGVRPPEELWPAHFDHAALKEKRKTPTSTGDEKNLSYAIPHADTQRATHPAVDIHQYELPEEGVLVAGLMWVGELVFDTLPLKQLKCVKGEIIGQISFEAQRETAVGKVV